MEEGTIVTWLKQDGEAVQAGEELVEIETDKATVTYAAEAAGVLTIVAAEGTTLPVGATIARLGDGPAAAPPSETVIGSSAVAVTTTAAEPVVADASTAVKATPLARRVAQRHGIALADVPGTGPLGRVTRADVLARAGLPPSPSPLPTAQAPANGRAPGAPTAGAPKGEVTVLEPTRVQATVARRMAEAKATVPDFQVHCEVTMDAAIALRAQLRAVVQPSPSLNDLVVKAAALALREHPGVNAAYRDGRFERYSRVNVGIAVATDDALVVPTIFDADQRSVASIAAEARRLATAVRDGTIAPPDLAGGTFTVSNLGMFGMSAMTPVINAPQAAILGVGASRSVLARVDGEVVDRELLTLTLSCDHRIVYGADAARFLARIRELLEQPLALLI
jgi:pyruvate dehydrogenase E2 component (dihydrolipoamide acetyltransferase)